jgi:SAM-dependent methyltransferase
MTFHDDASSGWDAKADEFLAISSNIGADTITRWASFLKPGDRVLDAGCGYGGGYTQRLVELQLSLYAIDGSPKLLSEYRQRFPQVEVACEAAESSSCFDLQFDGILCIGLIFLLSPEKQAQLLNKLASRLNDGGRLLFTAPWQVCDWDDLLTRHKSCSLGRDEYIRLLEYHGVRLINEYTDEGENHYFDFQRIPQRS